VGAGDTLKMGVAADKDDSMDPLFNSYLGRQGIFIPVAVSVWYLGRLWREGELYGTSGTLFCAWFVVALLLQMSAPGPLLWIVGVLAQVALAVTLILRQQLDEPF
jgi:hypothetical protein